MNVRDRSSYESFNTDGGHLGLEGNAFRVGEFTFSISFESELDHNELATKWGAHLWIAVDERECTIGFVPSDPEERTVQCKYHDTPVGKQWDRLLTNKQTSSDGRRKYFEVKVRSDMCLLDLRSYDSELLGIWACSHKSWCQHQNITETVLQYHRPTYVSIAMLSGSTLLDTMTEIKGWLTSRLKSDHDITLDPKAFDIVWEDHEFEGENVGIATVMADEETKDDIEEALLLIEPCDKIKNPRTHNLSVHSTIRFAPVDQVHRALSRQKLYLRSRHILIMDGLGTKPERSVPQTRATRR